MRKLAGLKKWLTLEDAAKYLSLMLEESVKPEDILQLALERHIVLSVNLVNDAFCLYSDDLPAEQAVMSVMQYVKGYSKLIGRFRIEDGVPDKWLKAINKGEYHYWRNGCFYTDEDGNERVVDAQEQAVSRVSGVWDLTMIGAEELDVQAKFHVLTGGQKIELDYERIVVLRNDEGQLCLLQERHPTEYRVEQNEALGWSAAREDSRYWHPAHALPKDAMFVVRAEQLRALIAHLDAASEECKKAAEPKLSDRRLQVIAALIEHADIKLHDKTGQGAALQRLVHDVGYLSVSADVCERMVKEIKNRMQDWD